MKYRQFIVALAVSAAATFSPAYGQTTEGQSVGAAIEQIASGLAGRIGFAAQEIGGDEAVSYTHLTLPTICFKCRSRWSPDH